jgi:flagellar motor switch protein FliN/FliY
MSDQIDFAPLQPSPMGAMPSGGDLDRLTDVSVELTVEVGRTRMTLGQTLGLGPGAVVHLDHLADKPVDLLVNGRVIARGEVVVVDEEFGLRITEVVGPTTAKPPVVPAFGEPEAQAA